MNEKLTSVQSIGVCRLHMYYTYDIIYKLTVLIVVNRLDQTR